MDLWSSSNGGCSSDRRRRLDCEKKDKENRVQVIPDSTLGLRISVSRQDATLVLWSRGWESNPLQPSVFVDAYYGLLRDVSAARRLSRSAFGGLANPGLFAPGDLDCAFQNCISLLRTGGVF